MQTALAIVFWTAAGLLVYGQFVYPLLVAALAPPAGDPPPDPPPDELPSVSLIVAAYAEAGVIADKVANARALDYPREKLQIIVACDGSPDDTARLRLAVEHGGLDELATVTRTIESSGGLEYTAWLARREADLAIDALSRLPESAFSGALRELADFAVGRSY